LTIITKLHTAIFGVRSDNLVGQLTLFTAVIGFVVHLGLWLVSELGIITMSPDAAALIGSPLSALYTPFSILLVYEVYLLIRAIPESFSTAVGKQYEVACLLVVRDVFKRLSEIEFGGTWALDSELVMVLIECVTFLLLLYTALSYRTAWKTRTQPSISNDELATFVQSKKIIAICLAITFLVVAISSFFGWVHAATLGRINVGRDIFFLDFFTCLILTDILILLISYRHSTDFYSLVRNTGFVLSTVILRVAISAPGLSSMVLFATSGILGIAILKITSHFASVRTANSSPS